MPKGLIARWIVISVVVVFGLGGLSLAYAKVFRPAFMEVDREVQQESHQYVDSQKTFMLQKHSAICELYAEIEELELMGDTGGLVKAKESQIKRFTNEIRERAELIDESEVPESVREYLENAEDGLSKEDCQ